MIDNDQILRAYAQSLGDGWTGEPSAEAILGDARRASEEDFGLNTDGLTPADCPT